METKGWDWLCCPPRAHPLPVIGRRPSLCPPHAACPPAFPHCTRPYSHYPNQGAYGALEVQRLPSRPSTAWGSRSALGLPPPCPLVRPGTGGPAPPWSSRSQPRFPSALVWWRRSPWTATQNPLPSLHPTDLLLPLYPTTTESTSLHFRQCPAQAANPKARWRQPPPTSLWPNPSLLLLNLHSQQLRPQQEAPHCSKHPFLMSVQ